MNTTVQSMFGQSLCTFVLNLIMMLFFKKAYGRRYKSKALYISLFITAFLIMVAVNHFGILIVNILYGVLSFNAICLIFYNARIRSSLLLNLLLIFLLLASDVASVVIWTCIGGQTLNDVLSNSMLMLISNTLNILIMITIYKIFTDLVCNRDFKSTKLQEILSVIFLFVFEIFILYIFTIKADSSKDGTVIFTLLVGFILLNLYITYIINRIASYYRLKYELELTKRQNQMQLSNYSEISSKYEESRKVIHDIKKHMNILSELSKTDSGEAKEYSQMIEKEVDSLFVGFKCSNQILSIVLSQKISKAESLGIRVDTRVEDLSLDFINDLDITALFANLWDNAIESCQKVRQEPYIFFSMNKVNGFIIVNMRNSLAEPLRFDGDKILSSKPNHRGVGLSIITSTVKKYNGLYKNRQDNGEFINEITIPL